MKSDHKSIVPREDIRRRSMKAAEALRRLWKIEGIKIDISTTCPEYHQHDSVSGYVRISMSKSQEPHFCERLALCLDEYRPVEKGGREYKTMKSVLLAGMFNLEPGSVREFSFDIRLPPNCTITRNEKGMQLYAFMDIPVVPLLHPNRTRKLKILPAREFIAIIKTLKENMGFVESTKNRERAPLLSWKSKSRHTYFRFMPPKPVRERIKYLGLKLSQTGDKGVRGNLVFETPNKSLIDHFEKSLFKRDTVKPFHLRPAEIFLPDGRPNRNAIIEIVGSLIW